jgi:hypothetical protein
MQCTNRYMNCFKLQHGTRVGSAHTVLWEQFTYVWRINRHQDQIWLSITSQSVAAEYRFPWANSTIIIIMIIRGELWEINEEAGGGRWIAGNETVSIPIIACTLERLWKSVGTVIARLDKTQRLEYKINFNSNCCFVWDWLVGCHIEERTQLVGIWEQKF